MKPQTDIKKFIFTFGCGQENAGYYQEIYAKNSDEAREKMFEMYGDKWAFQYTEEDWERNKERAVQNHYPIERKLP